MLTPIRSCVIGDTISTAGIIGVINGRVWSKGMVVVSFDNDAEARIDANANVVRLSKRPVVTAFIPVEGESYVCGVTGGEARPASEFVSGAYIGPVCIDCHRDGSTYGWD